MTKKKPIQEFGSKVRELRQAKKISLREFATRVGMSPTYLSKIERNEFPPPAEDKVLAIAKELNEDPDELLALAGKVASDLPKIIQQNPRELASFLRSTKGCSASDLMWAADEVIKRMGRTGNAKDEED